MSWLVPILCSAFAVAIGMAIGWEQGYRQGQVAPVTALEFDRLVASGYSEDDALAIMEVESRYERERS